MKYISRILITIILLNSFQCTEKKDNSDRAFNYCVFAIGIKKDVAGEYSLNRLFTFNNWIVAQSTRTFYSDTNMGTQTSTNYVLSRDGGKSWENLPLPAKAFSESYSFFSASDALYNLRTTSLDRLLYRESLQWDSLSFSNSSNESFLVKDIYDNNKIILATKSSGYKYDTNIQGLVKLFNFNSGGDISRLDFIDANTGWIVSSNRQIYNTTDGGQNWSLKYTFPTNSFSTNIFALSNTNLYFTNSNILTYTLDSGVTWLTYTFPSTKSLDKPFFFSTSIGFIIQDGILYRSSDQGNSWNKSFPNSNFTDTVVSHISIDNNLSYLISAKSIYKTQNSGVSWTLINSNIDPFTYQIRAFKPLLCEF